MEIKFDTEKVNILHEVLPEAIRKSIEQIAGSDENTQEELIEEAAGIVSVYVEFYINSYKKEKLERQKIYMDQGI